MRIIAGQWRSRRLCFPGNDSTRPMPDRVKESIFNKLGSYYGCPGELPPLHVADVFAGSGSMGLEALSRGAVSCAFFERSPDALAALKRNLAAMEAGNEATVVRGDAWHRAVTRPPAGRFDLIFLDPPFADSQDTTAQGSVERYLQRVRETHMNDLLVVWHHESRVALVPDFAEGWQRLDERRFGRNAVTFLVL